MAFTTSFKRGDIVLVPFPFTDLSTTKQRPALIVSQDALNDSRSDVIVAAITSQLPSSLGIDELRIADEELSSCGLPKPSIVRLGKILTIHQGLIRKKLGRVPVPTMEQMLTRLRELLS